jgi:hypothetical protein
MTAAFAAAPEAVQNLLSDLKREIRRLHACSAEFDRFVTIPEAPGRARRVVAVFRLLGHPASRCYVWRESERGRLSVVAVLHAGDVAGPEDAVRQVTALERLERERWSQEYA